MSTLHSLPLPDSGHTARRCFPGARANRAAGVGLSVLLVSLFCLPWHEADAQPRDGSVALYPELPGPSPLKNPYVEEVAGLFEMGDWDTALARLRHVRRYEEKAGRDSTILNWADFVEGALYFFKYINTKNGTDRLESIRAFGRVFQRDPAFHVKLRSRGEANLSEPSYSDFLAHVERIRPPAPISPPRILEASPVPGGKSSIDVQFKIEGSATPGGHVALFLEGLELDGTRAEGDGTWRLEIRLPYGRHILTAMTTDDGGRVSPASTGFQVVVERAPLPPAPAQPSPERPPGWLRGFMFSWRAGLEAVSANPEWVTGPLLEFFPRLPSDSSWLSLAVLGTAPVFPSTLDAIPAGISLSSPLTLRAELRLYPLDAPLPGKESGFSPYLLGGGGIVVLGDDGPGFSEAAWRLGGGVAIRMVGHLMLMGDAAVNFHPAHQRAAMSLSASGGVGLSF